MIEAALGIAAALAVPLGIYLTWIIKRKTSRAAEIEKQRRENEKAIANGTGGELLDHRLNRVPPNAAHRD